MWVETTAILDIASGWPWPLANRYWYHRCHYAQLSKPRAHNISAGLLKVESLIGEFEGAFIETELDDV